MRTLLTFLCLALAFPCFAQKSGMLQWRGSGGGSGTATNLSGQALVQVTNIVNALAGTNSVDGKLDITNSTARGFRATYTTGTTNPPFRVDNSNGLAIVFVNTNGFVGFNKTNPAVAVDIAGALNVSGTVSAVGTMTGAVVTAGTANATTAQITGLATAAQFRVTGLRVLGLQTNDSTLYLQSMLGGYALYSATDTSVAESSVTEADLGFLADILEPASSNLSGIHNITSVGTNTAAAFVGSGAGAGSLALQGTNGNNAMLRAANSNSVNVTNIIGLLHKAAASVITLDANHGNQFSITSRVSAATSVVLTNSAEGQDIEFTILGEASGGAARVITVIPQLGHLVANLDTFGSALATSFSFTLTNGNAAEVSTRIRKLNGTNIASVVTRQFSF